jgi:uncharacterized damage-inducible protein DinB
MNNFLANLYLKEIEAEAAASRKCLERIPGDLYGYKPHEKSMVMGYLTLLVAEVPMWISSMVEGSEIDFATFKHEEAKTAEEMVNLFDRYIEGAKKALGAISDEALDETFYLKSNGQVLMSMPKKEFIGSTINHWVHHRGQLTVYMRLNDIPVPAIYGPSADEQGF